MEVTVKFGELEVPFTDLQDAFANRRNMVILGDGSFGMLQDEWLQQFHTLVKMNDKSGTSLKVSKKHFMLLELLSEHLDDEAVLAELEARKQQLARIGTTKLFPVSKKIKAQLRPYQSAGFNWLQVLHDLGWGGCLADDMGLGKTLQTIAFLQFVKEQNKKLKALVVCPTSLMFNWESELDKFCPTLKKHIHHGLERGQPDELFDKNEILITSYGTMRNDIEHFASLEFDYVILDESQSIKNPDAQVSKAAQLLKSKNKIILSGTPLQNNTYDLFSQMNFLNPGLLGDREFFKTEFANQIDKNGSFDQSAILKKMISPFVLRRTKEQVASDLPDKSEIVMWCEMGAEQRSVYEQVRNYYRHELMKKIDEVGISKAGIYVLEGLLRLRQVCDSPVLLKSEEIQVTASIKIEELLRELLENTSNHKALVFSQFTEMLKLIATKLENENVSFVYLDGSTPAKERKSLVEKFQNEQGIQVFLISLKAGGVGLNLTAADYVYLVDPWWNPAAEQQAIDRAHRIGQQKKVFAYKMICKNSVEEKILQLQQKKSALAKELISEQGSVLKKITREDVEFLFS